MACAVPRRAQAAGLTDANVETRLLRLVQPETPLPGQPVRNLVVLAAAVALPPVAAHSPALAGIARTSHLAM